MTHRAPSPFPKRWRYVPKLEVLEDRNAPTNLSVADALLATAQAPPPTHLSQTNPTPWVRGQIPVNHRDAPSPQELSAARPVSIVPAPAAPPTAATSPDWQQDLFEDLGQELTDFWSAQGRRARQKKVPPPRASEPAAVIDPRLGHGSAGSFTTARAALPAAGEGPFAASAADARGSTSADLLTAVSTFTSAPLGSAPAQPTDSSPATPDSAQTDAGRFFQPGPANPSGNLPAAAAALGRLPLAFEPNRGQADPQVQFLARGPGYTLFLTAAEAVMVLTPPANHSPGAGAEAPEVNVLRMQLVGANPGAAAAGLDELPGKTNYLRGAPSQWVTDVPHYARVAYPDVYPGVDLVYYGTSQRQLEYDFVVAPGADPRAVRLAFPGADGMTLDDQGNLVLRVGNDTVTQHAPVI